MMVLLGLLHQLILKQKTMKTLILFLSLILFFGCSKPKEEMIFCHVETTDNISAKAILEFEIDGIITKQIVFLPYEGIHYAERYIILRWLPQRTSYTGYLMLGKEKFIAEQKDWIYFEAQINLKKPNGMDGKTWLY